MSMLCKKEDIPLQMSKFYIKTNKVVENVHETDHLNMFTRN